MKITVLVENIKCGGCANGIQQKLLKVDGISAVEVDIEQGLVECEMAADSEVDTVSAEVKKILHSMGYPEKGSVEGLQAAGAKAKSYVSCAVGKMTAEDKDD